MTFHSGKCLCGEISYQIDGDPVAAGVCHCKNCQRQAGAAFSTLWGIPKAAIQFTGALPKCYLDGDTASGGQVSRYFCGNCGSALYSEVPGQKDILYLKTGTLDDTDSFSPDFHAWCDSKQSWVDIPDGVTQMARQ